MMSIYFNIHYTRKKSFLLLTEHQDSAQKDVLVVKLEVRVINQYINTSLT